MVVQKDRRPVADTTFNQPRRFPEGDKIRFTSLHNKRMFLWRKRPGQPDQIASGQAMADETEQEPRFICDDHLGKLARYLRVGGFDTLFDKGIDNSRLIQISLDEKRHILTRDRRLIERRLVRYYFLVNDDRWQNQIKAVIEHFGLSFGLSRLFTRCLEDNTLIEKVDKKDVERLVFSYTYEHHSEFFRCPACGRIYWSGSHIEVMLDRLKDAGIDIRE